MPILSGKLDKKVDRLNQQIKDGKSFMKKGIFKNDPTGILFNYTETVAPKPDNISKTLTFHLDGLFYDAVSETTHIDHPN